MLPQCERHSREYWSKQGDESYQKALQLIDEQGSKKPWTPKLCKEVQVFLYDRLDSFKSDPQIGIMKADSDTRDFLAICDPEARISAMLDWERVNYGYVLYDCLLAYQRLVLMDCKELWPFFCVGYEKEMGTPLVQNAGVEYYLMWVGLRATKWNPKAYKIVFSLIEGRRLPFEQRQ